MPRLFIKIVLWSILSLICVEFAMIVLDPYLFKTFYQYDPNLGFRVRAHHPSPDGGLTNQFGFNDRDHPLQKTPGTFRLMVLSDSFNWVGGREGNYTALLQKKFDELYGARKVEVVNAGYPMTHTGEQLAILRKYGLQYGPDLVVLGFCVGNDFIEADPDRKRIAVNGIYGDISKGREYSFLGYPLFLQSRLYLLMKQKYWGYRERMRAEKEAANRQGPRGAFSQATFLNIRKKTLDFFNSSHPGEGRFQPQTDHVFQSLTQIDALLKSRNIKFVIAVYPDEFQVDPSLLQSIFEKFELRREDYDLDRAQKLLKSFAESKNIPVVDLTDRFREQGKGQDLYLLRNTHWNAAGNKLAAEILFEDLVKRVERASPSR